MARCQAKNRENVWENLLPVENRIVNFISGARPPVFGSAKTFVTRGVWAFKVQTVFILIRLLARHTQKG